MVDILKVPDIMNPFNVPSLFTSAGDLSEDLSLDLLVNQAELSGEKPLNNRLFCPAPVDHLETITYRQDVFQELIDDNRLRENVWSITRTLHKLKDQTDDLKSRDNSPSLLKRGLGLLRFYISFVNTFPDLNSANSKALRDISAYFRQIKDSAVFRETSDLVDKIASLEGVQFHVSLDQDGTPLSMSALELVERKEKPQEPEQLQEPKNEEVPESIWRRIIGRRKQQPKEEEQENIEHESLRDSYYDKLNNLGSIICEFMEKQFNSVIREYAQQAGEITHLLEPLEFYAAFSSYFAQLKAKGFDICRPTLLPKEERRCTIRNARNPLVYCGKRLPVPNDITSTPDENMFVLTGPNNGGKTTYVKTVGLLQVLAQSGLFVPATSAAISFVDGIYTHFVAPDDITDGDGRYRNELKRMKSIFENASPYSLVILDEPCGGTSYEEGERQSLALLNGFHKLGSRLYFTTHMHPVATEVERGRFRAARNLSVGCEDTGERLIYTFRVVPGPSGRSYGEEIAREIGLRPVDIEDLVSQRAEKQGFSHLLRR